MQTAFFTIIVEGVRKSGMTLLFLIVALWYFWDEMNKMKEEHKNEVQSLRTEIRDCQTEKDERLYQVLEAIAGKLDAPQLRGIRNK